LFSGWKSDIILATGCNSDKLDIKRCPKCGRITICLDGQVQCSYCGSELKPLRNSLDYHCSQCDFKLERQRTDEFGGFGYLCDYRDHKRLAQDPSGSKIYCSKDCVIQHCQLVSPTCELKKRANDNISDKRSICRICQKYGNNGGCKCCNLEYDIFGYDDNKVYQGRNCLECNKRSCSPFSINIDLDPKCPRCKGKLISNDISTFSAFIDYIWEFKGSERDEFVSSFENEAKKINDLIDILRVAN
jgi:hypothetical protein